MYKEISADRPSSNSSYFIEKDRFPFASKETIAADMKSIDIPKQVCSKRFRYFESSCHISMCISVLEPMNSIDSSISRYESCEYGSISNFT